MYLRHTTVRKNGKVQRYWRLVRSVRVGRRVIQQTVAHLGELDERGRIEARALARHLIGSPEQAQLFDDGSEHLTVPVRLKGIAIERSRQFGDVYLALALWRGIGLEAFCERLLPVGQERIAWAKMATVLVAARFCEPSSELHIAEDWYRRTALCDLLQLGDEQITKDRLYRGLDHLLAHKAALEAHLSQRCGELFAVTNEVLLYDVTSTYFEGRADGNAQAQRGYSRDHRPDCKQVLIALVVTFDGFPLGYEVFAGNTHDSRTLQTIVATMEARHGMLGRVWITDRGMASAENLAWLRATGRRYIIGAPKSELKRFGGELARADGWRMVQDGVEVKLTRHPDTNETVILCRSADRRSKEKAMHDKFSARIEAALQRLAARVVRAKKPLDPAKVNRQIGRILQQNQRAAARFAIALEPDGCPAGFRILTTRPSTTGPRSRRAPICCAPTSVIGAINNCGRPTSNSPRPRPHSAFRKTSSRYGRSGINARTAFRRTFSSASSPSCCGRAWRCGSSVPASETRRAPFSKSSRAFSRTISCCRPRPMALSTCGASPSPIRLRPPSSTASALSCPNACASPNANCQPSPAAPNPNRAENVVPTFPLRH
jgi:hypothetical protein